MDSMEELKDRLAQVEEEKREAEDNMIRAAHFGKELLEKNQELEAKLEAVTQIKHETQLQLQTKARAEQALLMELEMVNEDVRRLEKERDGGRLEEERDGDMLAQREDHWRNVSELELKIEQLEVKETGLLERLRIAEKQVEEANKILNQSVVGSTNSEEVVELQQENLALLQKNQSLQSEVARFRAEAEEERVRLKGANDKVELLTAEVEELQCQVTGYSRAVEAAKEEVMELEARLEAVKVEEVGNSSREDKGNSLFSEVEDRRCLLERQMVTMQKKYDSIKEVYDSKVQQLTKVKVHNTQLLRMLGSRGGGGNEERLEELLAAERDKNRDLANRLEALEQLGCDVPRTGSGGASSTSTATAGTTDQDDGKDTQRQHTGSEEYTYLVSMLEETQAKNDQLKKQLQQQLRQNLEESDKLREMSRKVHATTLQMQKLRADNYGLKVQLEQARMEEHRELVGAERKREAVVEMLKFDTKKEIEEEVVGGGGDKSLGSGKTRDNTDKETGHEEVLLLPHLETARYNKLEEAVEEDKHGATDKERRRAVSIKEVVREIDMDGREEEVTLQEEEAVNKEKLRRPRKPMGRKRFGGAQNTVMAAENTTEEECKQQ